MISLLGLQKYFLHVYLHCSCYLKLHGNSNHAFFLHLFSSNRFDETPPCYLVHIKFYEPNTIVSYLQNLVTSINSRPTSQCTFLVILLIPKLCQLGNIVNHTQSHLLDPSFLLLLGAIKVKPKVLEMHHACIPHHLNP
jgi:hypothetical protein